MKTQLYIISPPQIEDVTEFAQKLDEALAVGGVGAFQLRLKDETVNSPQNGRVTLPHAREDTILEAAEILKPICHKYDVAFILNDSPELALKCDADGVHVGQEDGSIKEIREMVGKDMVIGATCHDSRHLAMVAGEDGADYIAFGAFFPTSSKTPEALAKYGTPSVDIIEWWTTYTVLPCVAIGGITPNNCRPIVKAGADFIAVISAIWNHQDGPAAAVREFVKTISSSNAP